MSISKIVDFRNIRLEPAENGWILEFTKVTENPLTMDSADHSHKQMIFRDDEIDSAIAKMRELLMFKKLRKTNPELDTPSLVVGKES